MRMFQSSSCCRSTYKIFGHLSQLVEDCEERLAQDEIFFLLRIAAELL